MFHVYAAAIALYAASRLFLPLSMGRGWKAGLVFLFLLISQLHLSNRIFFGTMASPELPRTVLVVQGWLLAVLILAAVFVLARDMLTLLFALTRRLHGRRCSLSSSRALAAMLCALSAALAAFGVWQGLRVPEVRTVEAALKSLPPELDGMRLVQLTDMHASRLLPGDWVSAVVSRTNALNPDLILVTGDMVDGAVDKRTRDVEPLRGLRARYGVFAVPGNHEYYSGYAEWMDVFRAMGWRMLLNEHVRLAHNGTSLILAGVTDKASARFGAPVPQVQAALAGAPERTTTILMEHRPENAVGNAGAGVDLQLSGHTHGGQIAGLHLLVQYVNRGFVSGMYALGPMKLYVSSGAGLWNGFPVRLGRPAEIMEIILRREP